MNRGVYKNNPGETMKTCQFCHREFHHMGLSPHQRACSNKTPDQRQQYFLRIGKYAWSKLRHSTREMMVPAKASIITSPAPKRGRKKGLPAPSSIIEADGKRYAITLSFDPDTVRDVASRLLRSARMEDLSIK